MRKYFVPAVLVVSMAVGSSAFAASAPKHAKVATTAASAKAADCMKQWKAQKTHTGDKKAFLAACEKA